MRRLWKNRLPMKVRVFMWLACHNRIQSGEVLGGMKWKGNKNCRICNVLETTDHIFFHCPLAKFVWASLKEMLGRERVPRGLWDLFEMWLPLGCNSYNLKFFCVSAVLWGIWLARNKMAIEGIFVQNPTEVVQKICVFLQRWKPRLKPADQSHLEEGERRLGGWIKNFKEKTRPWPPEDIFI
jgi:hypothetical protein